MDYVICVELPARPTRYPIEIKAGGLAHLGKQLKALLPKARKVLIISDPNVAPLYLHSVLAQLAAEGLSARAHITPVFGEGAKTLAGAEAIYQQAQDIGLSRQDVILALGGGVVGDLAGFCAATFYRGVQFVQVPTTLLAQVDSSVGGKVAVNFGTRKNGIGAFYQPAFVLIDPDTLNTLPEREIKAGLAEVLKYGLIENSIPRLFHSAWADKLIEQPSFIDTLATLTPHSAPYTDVSRLKGQEGVIWDSIIEACCQMKAAVVAADETETLGIRAILNLGHTFAHAYEEAGEYQVFLHGEAVALGMRHACWLAEQVGMLPAAEVQRFETLARQLRVMMTFPEGFRPDAQELLDLMRHDKKASGGKITLILPEGQLANVCLRDDIPDTDILAVLQRVLNSPVG